MAYGDIFGQLAQQTLAQNPPVNHAQMGGQLAQQLMAQQQMRQQAAMQQQQLMMAQQRAQREQAEFVASLIAQKQEQQDRAADRAYKWNKLVHEADTPEHAFDLAMQANQFGVKIDPNKAARDNAAFLKQQSESKLGSEAFVLPPSVSEGLGRAMPSMIPQYDIRPTRLPYDLQIDQGGEQFIPANTPIRTYPSGRMAATLPPPPRIEQDVRGGVNVIKTKPFGPTTLTPLKEPEAKESGSVTDAKMYLDYSQRWARAADALEQTPAGRIAKLQPDSQAAQMVLPQIRQARQREAMFSALYEKKVLGVLTKEEEALAIQLMREAQSQSPTPQASDPLGIR